MQKIENFKIDQIPVYKILITVTSEPGYEMDRVYVVERYPDYGLYTVVTGGHCSCYDFDETSWDAITYTEEEMHRLMSGWKTSGYVNEEKVAEIWFETVGSYYVQ